MIFINYFLLSLNLANNELDLAQVKNYGQLKSGHGILNTLSKACGVILLLKFLGHLNSTSKKMNQRILKLIFLYRQLMSRVSVQQLMNLFALQR